MNKGINGRYRGKLLLICFNCDGIGHFANKCPHKKNRNDECYSKRRQTYKGKRTTKKFFKKIFCTKKNISSSDEDEVSDSEIGRVLFIVVKELIKKTPNKNMNNHMKKKLKRQKLTSEKN
jgi:hypothetical protein